MILKQTKGAEQQTNFEENEKFIQTFLLRFEKPQLSKRSSKRQSLNFPKLDALQPRNIFLNTQKINTLNLTSNLEFMDPNDVTYQLNQMMTKNQFTPQKPIMRIHQSLQPKRRLTSRMFHELSKTTKII